MSEDKKDIFLLPSPVTLPPPSSTTKKINTKKPSNTPKKTPKNKKLKRELLKDELGVTNLDASTTSDEPKKKKKKQNNKDVKDKDEDGHFEFVQVESVFDSSNFIDESIGNTEANDEDGLAETPPNKEPFEKRKIFDQLFNKRTDLFTTVIDEISLEGLDGITLEALWLRISVALEEPLPLQRKMQIHIWEIIRSASNSGSLQFYELPQPRPKLEIFDRFEHIDPVSGAIVNPAIVPEDIYPFKPTLDVPNDIIGSCMYYHERNNVTYFVQNLTLDEAVLNYRNKLVIVANQKLRNLALFNEYATNIKLTEQEYCLLERIGRSRKLGEVTTGKLSMQLLCKDPKTLFYYRKVLIKHKLIHKQTFVIKYGSQNVLSGLYHLTRFFNEYKSKKQILIEQIVELIKKKDKCRIEYIELKRSFEKIWVDMCLQKVLKSSECKQFLQTKMLPYRELYPDASEYEWKNRTTNNEKMIRVLELVDPNINVNFTTKDEEQKEESSDDEPVGEISITSPLYFQFYKIIFAAGKTGISIREVQTKTGLDFYTTRSIINNLNRRNLIDSIMVDSGRQRLVKYFTQCANHTEFYEKMKEENIAKQNTFENCDNDTLDFIADVLEIDSAYLKKQPDLKNPPDLQKQPDLENQLENDNNASLSILKVNGNAPKAKYDLIRELRLKNRTKNDFLITDVDGTIIDSETLTNIYSNTHDYNLINFSENSDYSAKLPLEKNKIKINPDFKKVCFEIISEENNECDRFPKQPFYNNFNDFKNVKDFNNVPSKKPRFYSNYIKKHPKESLGKQILKMCQTTNLKFVHFKQTLMSARLLLQKLENLQDEFKYPDDLEHEHIEDEYDNLNHTETSSLIVETGFIEKQEKFENLREYESLFHENIREIQQIISKNEEIISENQQIISENQQITPDNRPIIPENQQIVPENRQIIPEGRQIISENLQKIPEKDAIFTSQLIKEFEKSDCSLTDENYVINIEKNQTSFDTLKTLMVEQLNTKLSNEKIEIKADTIIDSRLGPKPILLREQTDADGIIIKIYESTKPEDIKDTFSGIEKIQRFQTRANLIKDYIYNEKCITDLSIIYTNISTNEIKEGSHYKADRKSLYRIYNYLIKLNAIKLIKIALQHDNITRVKYIGFKPDYDPNPIIETIINQMKISFFVQDKKQNLKITKMNQKKIPYRLIRVTTRSYGYLAKYSRIRELHEYLFYLIYDYTHDEIINVEEIPEFLNKFDIQTNDSFLIKELSTIYNRSIDWKLFVPPLPEYNERQDGGWALVADLLMLMPLSIYVKLFSISFFIPEVNSYYLNHPIRRHILVKNLPTNIRNALFYERKYLFSMNDMLLHLCYMGLLQFGPQIQRHKDQIFIYLNRNAILYDTTPSDPGYHKISKKCYDLLTFQFTTTNDVKHYWSQLWNIAMQTKLGKKLPELGRFITIENIAVKTDMINACKPVSVNEATENDVGYLPGDKLGAGCLDSACWVHVKKNWNWINPKNVNKSSLQSTTSLLTNITGLRKKHLDKINCKTFQFKELVKKRQQKQITGSNKNKKKIITNNLKKKNNIRVGKKDKIIRQILHRRSRTKQLYFDEVDKMIRNKYGNVRSIWSKEEDELLLLCHTVFNYLCVYVKRKFMSYTVIRDIMHILCSNQHLKVSRAYQRRLNSLRKKNSKQQDCCTRNSNIQLSEVYNIHKYFKNFRLKLKTKDFAEKQLNIAFVYAVKMAYDHLKYHQKQPKGFDTTYANILTNENIKKLEIVEDDEGKEKTVYKDPVDEMGVTDYLIKSIILCTLNCNNNNSVYKLFNIYQKFSDTSLKIALNSLKNQQIITSKKSCANITERTGVQLTGRMFYLSFLYVYKQFTSFPPTIFDETQEFTNGITRRYVKVPSPILVEKEQQSALLRNVENNLKVEDVSFNNIEENEEVSTTFLPTTVASASSLSATFASAASSTSLPPTSSSTALSPVSSTSSSTTLPPTSSTTTLPPAPSTTTLPPASSSTLPPSSSSSITTEIGISMENFNQGHGLAMNEYFVTNNITFTFKIADEILIMNPNVKDYENLVNELIKRYKRIISKEKPEKTSVNKNYMEKYIPSGIKENDNDIRNYIERIIKDSLKMNDGDEDKGYGKNKEQSRLTDLAFLLTKGLFPDLDDEHKLEELNNCFLVVYPTPTLYLSDESDYLSRRINYSYEDMVKDIERELIIKISPMDNQVVNLKFRHMGANACKVISDIIALIRSCGYAGASSETLKTYFNIINPNLNLLEIIEQLLELNIIFKMGVKNFRFVHYDFIDEWTLSTEGISCTTTITTSPVKKEISMSPRVKVMPWISVDGTINDRNLQNWLKVILSHCLSYPYTNLENLFNRFCYIKPVDIYFLLEYLQRLDCLKLLKYEKDEVTLFSDYDNSCKIVEGEVNLLDNFENIFVETKPTAITALSNVLRNSKSGVTKTLFE